MGHRDSHAHRLLQAAADAVLAPEPDRLGAGAADSHGHFALHLAAVEVAQPGGHLQAADVGLQPRPQPQPVDDHAVDELELHRAPEPQRHLPPVGLGQAEKGAGGIGPGVAVPEPAQEVALGGQVGLDWRFTADDQRVLRLQVGREVEAEGREIAIVRPQQPAVQPHVGGQEGAAEAEQDAAGIVGPREAGAVPDRAALGHRRLLGGHLDVLPAAGATAVQALGLPLAQRHPGALPAAQCAPAIGRLRVRQEEGVVHDT